MDQCDEALLENLEKLEKLEKQEFLEYNVSRQQYFVVENTKAKINFIKKKQNGDSSVSKVRRKEDTVEKMKVKE